ncbi:hypothetical protein [Nocardia sp. alder85J]|uniref:hypothetical protein n=1 Tax=Nocardia sp. alder85J TaxID=2862949 RepID=UPI001CD7C685|nr:hypothetical protein [Nocardia sp. alder85J]MCX4097909.1 hypothetical protein [Nocardia sp. alder85J]MCX4098197.1 hypothetical protein [Nocardia sp. alder85J]
MTSQLAWILWPGSVFATAVISYRIGTRVRAHDSTSRDPAEGPIPAQDLRDSVPMNRDEAELPPLPPPPVRWWIDEDDTAILPRIP